MKVKIVRTIREVEPGEWNRVTRGPFFSHEWFRWVEETEGHRCAFYYFLVTEGDQFIGAVPAFVPLHHGDIYRNYLYGKFRRWIDKIPGPDSKPLICHCLGSSGKNLFSDQEFFPGILPVVTETVQEIASEEGFSEFVFIFVREHEKKLCGALEASGFRGVFLSAAGILENHFESFEDYIQSLSRNGRNSVRRDLRRFEKGGCTVTICEDPGKNAGVIAGLVENIEKKYPSTLTKFDQERLKSVFQKMAPYQTAYLIHSGGAAIGATTLFEKDSLLMSFAAGLDYSRIKENNAYFYTFYYLPIQEMIRKKAPYLNFNHMTYLVKTTRGAALVAQYMFIKNLKPALAKQFWFGVVERRYRSKFRREYARDAAKREKKKDGETE